MENKNIIVRIPEPCHEDWNKMTPDKTGKFCGSCQKSVVDFTNKTDAEIKDILMQNQGQKLCGHFKKSQVDRPLNIRVNLNDVPRNMSITKMFAVALLLTFSVTLFSCYDPQGKKINGIELTQQEQEKVLMTTGMVISPEYMNKVEEVAKEDTLKKEECEPMVDGEMHVEQYVAGGIGMHMVDPIIDSVYTAKVLPQDSIYEMHKTGEVVAVETITETIVHQEESKDSIPDWEKIHSSDRIMGGPMAVETVTEEVTQTQNVTASVEEKGNNIIKENSFVIFPNPGKGDFTIKYEVMKRSEVRVDVLDAQGKLITNISDIPKQYEGKYEIPVSLDVPNGIYFVSIIADGKKSVSKVVVER